MVERFPLLKPLGWDLKRVCNVQWSLVSIGAKPKVNCIKRLTLLYCINPKIACCRTVKAAH